MYDKELAHELICLIIDNIETVRKRTASINSSSDFTNSESGMHNPELTTLNLHGLIEKYGSGIRRIIDYFRRANLSQPEFRNII